MIDEFQVINEAGILLKNIFDKYKNKISFSNGDKTYSRVIGISSNKIILLSKYDYENIFKNFWTFVQ